MRQSSRLFFTFFYLALLFVLARYITGQWFYLPSGDASLWFQAGLLMVVLGSFFIEKHFTKPVDVVTNAAAGVITLIAIEHREKFLFWEVTLCGILLIGGIAFLSMVIQTFSRSSRILQVGNVLFTVSVFIGSAKRLFSIVLFLAVLSYFEVPSNAALLIFLFWALVVVSEPIGLPAFVDRVIGTIKSGDKRIGRVWKVVGGGTYQIELTSNLRVSAQEVLRITIDNEKIFAFPLDDFALKDKKILNAVSFSGPNPLREGVSSIASIGFVDIVPLSDVPEAIANTRAFQHRDQVLGFVDDNSDIEVLRFKLLSKIPLRDGHLVKVFVDDGPIVYQVINAITKSASHDGDEERYITVVAQQVGKWKEAAGRFESVDWVPKPASFVFAESNPDLPTLTIETSRQIVGKLPNSEYPIHVEINEIVTHHTAILGITGSGKTYLAYDLIRKMVESEIKVVIFDVSTDYARDLKDLSPTMLKTPADIEPFLGHAEQYLAIAEFQPTATNTLVKNTATSVGHVLVWAKQNLTSQHGGDIKAKVCVVFEEAHSLIPEWNSVSVPGDKDEVNKISQAILQGRKYGVGALVITQRTANITKTILNQCNTIFALQSFDQTGLEFLKNYIGEDHAHALSKLLPRQSVLFGKASSSRRPVIVRLNEKSPEVPPAEESGLAESAE